MTALFTRDKPLNITSYDVIKTFALITMIIDHLGAFIFVDDLMLKAIGRWSFPVWLFLIGFAKNREIPMRLWVATGLITLSYLIFHHDLLPLNIFATIIITRLALPFFTKNFFHTAIGVATLLIGCSIILIPSYAYVEYGTTGLLFGFWGYLRRVNTCPQWLQHGFAIIIFIIHAGLQMIIYPFSVIQQQIAFAGIMVVMIALHYFKPKTYPNTGNYPIISPFLRFCGRYTLEIYTVHVILFTIISAYLYGEFTQIDWHGFSFDIPAGGFTRK